MRLAWFISIIGVGGFLLLLPTFAVPYLVSTSMFALMYIALAGSWNIISGFTGYVSFGHVAFFGVGAYTGAILISREGLHWVPAALLGGMVAIALSLIIGFPCLRLKGPYFAIAMLGLNEVMRIITLVWGSLTRGGLGIYLPPTRDITPYYYAMALVASSTFLLAWKITHSNYGLRLLAIREDEIAAETMGINTTWYKLSAFILSAFFPGVAGGIYVRYVSYIEPLSTFDVLITIQMIVMAMFGGRATALGPVIGAILLYAMAEVLWVRFPFLHQAAFGALIVVVVLFMPEGIMGLLRRKGIITSRL